MQTKTKLIKGSLFSIAVAVCISLLSCSEKEQKVYHVGILTDYSPFMVIADNFKAGMEELGYIEGENIVYDLQIKDFDPEAKSSRQAIYKGQSRPDFYLPNRSKRYRL